MLEQAINRILELNEPTIVEVGPYSYSDKRLSIITPPLTEAIHLSSLDSLVELMMYGSESDERHREIIHVESPTRVSVKSSILHFRNRETYYVVTPDLPSITFDRFMDLENFNIMLQSMFIDSAERAKVLSVVGSVTSSEVQSIDDDGISQQVAVTAGIHRKANSVVPNPVVLAPYRTFLEVQQPFSQFVLRMKDGPSAALFEADGGQWKLEAVKKIKEYLVAKLPSEFIVIA